MNTITINNKINKVAKKFNIKIDEIEIKMTPSWNYGEDNTNDTFEVSMSIKNPDSVSVKRIQNFIGNVEYACSKNWKYNTFIDITNKEY